MSDNGYKKKIVYSFEAGGETWEVFAFGYDYIHLTETRKNGHEDTHCYPLLEFKGGAWVLDEGSAEMLGEHRGARTAMEIVEFVRRNGPPAEWRDS